MHSDLKILQKTLTILTVTILILGFTEQANLVVGNWYQQLMPNNLPNFQVSDIFFLDSLTGWAVTGNSNPNDTSGYILKTTNGGDNWILKFTDVRDFSRVKFINSNTGFVSGGYNNGAKLYKSTDGGNNWFTLFSPSLIYFDDMSILNEDTIWLVDHFSIEGGIFRTTNAGINWTTQYSTSNQNPSHIYMYNARIGFMDGGNLKRTTDGGSNWTSITGEGQFFDMYFIDSLTGWKCSQTMKKTTDGGLSWITQTLPQGGIILVSSMLKFSNVNRDTIWGVGGQVFYGAGQFRGMIYKTTNGGNNWGFQIPDTTIHIGTYTLCDFYNKQNGWAYTSIPTGVHTVTEGDTTTYMGIIQISHNVPDNFQLKQNYPNPFNPRTIISYSIKKDAYVKMTAYNILGQESQILVNQKQNAGEYYVDFMGKFAPSGVYFYRMEVIDDNNRQLFTETKKMVLLK